MTRKTIARLVLLVLLPIFFIGATPTTHKHKAKPKILVFSKTAGYKHASIKDGIAAIMQLGVDHRFIVDTSSNSSSFNSKNLEQYSAIVFLNTTGQSTQLFTESEKDAFRQYIRNGGGYVGIHAATDCCYDWPWYGNLSGAYFGGHPAEQEADFHVTDAKHRSTKHLPSIWKRKDELYSFKWIANDLKILLTIDEKTYNPGKHAMGDNHPMAWYHSYDGGRAFYTALGHTKESYTEPLFLQHILGGIQYAMGVKK